MRLLYVMDPMCSWCYAFQVELDAFLEAHSGAEVDWIMGGLAPDTNQAMDENLKRTISSYWHQIEAQTQVSFNHDFWTLNTPYRSTYPACRAVISAETLKQNAASDMVKAIQSAYYKEARNPSLDSTLIDCAASIGIDEVKFKEIYVSSETEERLQQHLSISHQLQVRGFPALYFLTDTNQAYPLALGFCQTKDLEKILEQIKTAS